MSSIAVVYYSLFSATRRVAESICLLTDGNEIELIPEKQYSFDYNTASKEIRNQIERGYCPKLIKGNESIGEYETIFIGSPNWFRCLAPPVLGFIRNNDFTDKVIVPFCTHGGGGFGKIVNQIEKECTAAEIKNGLEVNGSIEDNKIEEWLKGIDIIE